MVDANFNRTNPVDPGIEAMVQAALEAQRQKNSLAITKMQMGNQSPNFTPQQQPQMPEQGVQQLLASKVNRPIGSDPLQTMAQLQELRAKSQLNAGNIQEQNLRNQALQQQLQVDALKNGKAQAFNQALSTGDIETAKRIDPERYTKYAGDLQNQQLDLQKAELARVTAQNKLDKPQETTIEKQRAITANKMYTKLIEDESKAVQVKSDASRLTDAYKQLKTGTYGEQLQAVRNLFGTYDPKSSYLSMSDAALGDVINQASNAAVVASLDGYAGSISERELALFKSGVAGLGKTAAGNIELTKIAQAAAEKTLAKKAFVDAFQNKFGNDKTQEAVSAWGRWVADPSHDIISMHGKQLVVDPSAVGDWQQWIDGMSTPKDYASMVTSSPRDQQRATTRLPDTSLKSRLAELRAKQAQEQ